MGRNAAFAGAILVLALVLALTGATEEREPPVVNVDVNSGGGALPAGTAVNNRLVWDVPGSQWVASSLTETTYFAIVRDDTFASLRNALENENDAESLLYQNYRQWPTTLDWALADATDGFNPNVCNPHLDYIANGIYNAAECEAWRAKFWPPGGEAPYMAILAPSWTGWIDAYGPCTFSYFTPGDAASNPPTPQTFIEDVSHNLTISRGYALINGVSYDLARTITRVTPTAAVANPRAGLRGGICAYVPPPDPQRTFTRPS